MSLPRAYARSARFPYPAWVEYDRATGSATPLTAQLEASAAEMQAKLQKIDGDTGTVDFAAERAG
jgi:hypothetical protein